MRPTILQVLHQLRDDAPLMPRRSLVEMIERPTPLTAPRQCAGIAEKQESRSGAGQRLHQRLRMLAVADGAMGVAARQTHERK